MGSMAQKIKIVYYLYEVKDEPLGNYAKAVESKLGRFVRLVNPDEYTLMTNFKSIPGTSKEAHVIEIRNDINRWFYLTKDANGLEKPKAAYEYEIGKEEALEAVFREIAEGSAHGKLGVDKFSAMLQLLLWGGFLLLSYLGYKNDELEWINSFLPLVLLLSGLIEGFRRGYKKRKK
ncbi:hypothetical protein [Thermococcus aciditolerans]|uniref:Uncharacterized protein n=1 Tax=Thermococcus aciditolerans TaxID=2598455 RepID=A0A5C0SJJ9_9EURY|nr:hypothetical protein [Thermococcus aciditolerans]QEK14430.1 hypothetical protein FPV09_04150 [Thermococcus aciditolerans]